MVYYVRVRFLSHGGMVTPNNVELAQLVEHLVANEKVAGSSPVFRSKVASHLLQCGRATVQG